MKKLLLIGAILLAASPAFAAKKKKRNAVDQLALAKVMLLDGHPARALALLQTEELPVEPRELAELHRLRGLAEHELGRHADASVSLERAIQHGENAPETWYALVNTRLAAGDAKGALATTEKAPPSLWTIPGAHRVAAHAFHQLGDRHRAFAAADTGFVLFPKEVELERMRVLLLLELGLSQEGLAAAKQLFAHADTKARDYVTLAAALASARDLTRAAELLEGAVLRFPEDRGAREQLARMYFEAGRFYSAALVLHPLALVDPESAQLTAELYRRSGKLDEALRVNGLVPDAKKKLRQRITLLIEAERYHEAAALDARAERLGLYGDEKVLYAIAYAQYVSGNFTRVEKMLGRISEPELFEKATAIRRALETCRADLWKCD